ncbi:MAG: TetR/AcrR family transcriptional regulator [Deltaproteobacteria bacterium]|uniref:TetR/AcrR family transcriptional regulator n=1 Tax=Candidatus Zymogenus saltonus TaxID=2844893 RepID=A0A9D8KF04_9DELT|nr:TetR/AcrR family transcriptional regulator [Candidatus Zymogenus saltonus]
MRPTPYDELKEQEREVRREMILSAALKLFAEKDYKSVTVREIAKEAGMSPGTIYRYYQNIDDLFMDVFVASVKEIKEIIDSECLTDKGCSLRRLCKVYINYLNDNFSFYLMMGHFMLAGKLSFEATGRLNPIMRDLIDMIEKVVIAISPDGKPKNSRTISHALFAALNGNMISYARYPGRTQEEIRGYILKLTDVVAGLFEESVMGGSK